MTKTTCDMKTKLAPHLRAGINPYADGVPSRDQATSLRLAAAFGAGNVPLYLINKEITRLLEEGISRATIDTSLIQLYTIDIASIGKLGRMGIEEALLQSEDPDTFRRFAAFWYDNYNTRSNPQWEGFHRATFILAMLAQKHAGRIPADELKSFAENVYVPFTKVTEDETFCAGVWESRIRYEEEQNDVIAMLIQFGLTDSSLRKWLIKHLTHIYLSTKNRHIRGTIRSFCLSGSDSRRDRIMRYSLLERAVKKEHETQVYDALGQAFGRSHFVLFCVDDRDSDFATFARIHAGASR